MWLAKKQADSSDNLADFNRDPRILLLSVMAVPIGVMGALVAYALVWLIGVITNLAFYHRFSAAFVSPRGQGIGWFIILVPVVGGMIVGLMARCGSEKIRGHGIPEALEAILVGGSRIEAKVAVLKPLSSAISIGTGGPFGAEGPIIMTGGAFGSLFAQLFTLTPSERKTLLTAGAAAGMSAVFATPVASVLIAVELLLFEWKPRSFIPVTLAAVVAALLRVPLLGTGPMFPVPEHAPLSPGAWLAALGVGIVAGLASGVLTAMVYGFEDLFRKLPVHWMWWPAIGGLFVGIAGWINPRVLGVGYDTIAALLHGDIGGAALWALLIGKSLAWSISLGSGTSGGVLAPLLIMGGALGAVESHWISGGSPGLWPMISMAAVMGGTMRSPFTAMIFTLELTHDLNVLPALLVACTAADTVTVLLLRRSILTEKLARRGHHLIREYGTNPLEMQRIGEVMTTNMPTISPDTKIRELADRIDHGDPWLTHHHAIPIVDDTGRLAGIITRGDVARAREHDHDGNLPVLSAGATDPIVTYPDELVYQAVVKMHRYDVGRLPVVDRRDPRRLVGYLGRSHVLSAFLRHIEQEQMRQPGSLSRMALTLKKNAVTRWMLNRAKKEPVPASPETKAPAR
jgi:H+/Cl- antiporter ClcA/CBS domain-containing protein